jgi:hypothetical protein
MGDSIGRAYLTGMLGKEMFVSVCVSLRLNRYPRASPWNSALRVIR